MTQLQTSSWRELTAAEMAAEVEKCRRSFAYFADRYCQILVGRGEGATWQAFHLWVDQFGLARDLQIHRLVVVLKARQLGITWLCIAFALWLMIFHPVATVLLFSTKEEDAHELLGDSKLRGMYLRLPAWLRARSIVVDNTGELELSNGSRALAFATTGGDGYTASFALVDEADLSPDLDRLMRSVKPTIDAGGRMAMVSRSDKTNPNSIFKNLYRGARVGKNGWHPVFLPYSARPERDQEWYERQWREAGSMPSPQDYMAEQYPRTDDEALAAESLGKRFPLPWLLRCRQESEPIFSLDAPPLPLLTVFREPEPGRTYVLGCDPAEGNPNSDDSSLDVLDDVTGEQVATLAGKVEMEAFAAQIDDVGTWYNNARACVERNNHGHAVLMWLRAHSRLPIVPGLDKKPGWNQTGKGKPFMLDKAATAFRGGAATIRDPETFRQLAAIDGSTNRAPEGDHDDRAVSYCLALVAITFDVSPEWEIKAVSTQRPKGDLPMASMKPVRFDGIKYFQPSDSYQPRPIVNGETMMGCPDFPRQDEAATFNVVLFQRLGLPRPDYAEAAAQTLAEVPDAEERRSRIEEKVTSYMRMKGLTRVEAAPPPAPVQPPPAPPKQEQRQPQASGRR